MLHPKEKRLEKAGKFEFIIDFKHFLPDGFLHRFYVRMARWSIQQGGSKKPTFHCREMLFTIDDKHRVVMENSVKSDEAHQIKVTIFAIPLHAGDEKGDIVIGREFIDYVNKTLKNLKDTWARRISFEVGVKCKNCYEDNDFSLIPLDELLTCTRLSVCCDECSDAIPVENVQRVFGKEKPQTQQDSGSLKRKRSDAEGEALYDSEGSSRKRQRGEGENKINLKRKRSDAEGEALYDSKGSSSKSEHGEGAKKIKLVTSQELTQLSAIFPPGNFSQFCDVIHVEYNTAHAILAKHKNNYQETIREILEVWRNRAPRNRNELDDILTKAGIGGLCCRF